MPDPTFLYRLRDGVCAADLLIGAVAGLDLFSRLAAHGPVPAADLRVGLGLAERPADVLLTYCAALGLVDRDLSRGDRIGLTEPGRRHLVGGPPYHLRPYFGSMAERPAVAELLDVLRTDRPAAWASAAPGNGDPSRTGRAGWIMTVRSPNGSLPPWTRGAPSSRPRWPPRSRTCRCPTCSTSEAARASTPPRRSPSVRRREPRCSNASRSTRRRARCWPLASGSAPVEVRRGAVVAELVAPL